MLKNIKKTLWLSLPKSSRSHLLKTYLTHLRPLLYSGKNVHCPVCGGDFRLFLPAGAKVMRRENAECPKCTCKERHRLFWLYLRNKTSLFSQKVRVLHFAPERFFQKTFLQMENLDYISAVLCSPLAMVKMDITDIPFKDEYFDVVLCSHVLEHVVEDRKAMLELYRVMRKGGWAILQVPIDTNSATTLEDPNITTPEDRTRFYWNPEHVRLYGRDYKDRLEVAGFQVAVDEYVKSFSDYGIGKYGLLKKENIYFCQKPI